MGPAFMIPSRAPALTPTFAPKFAPELEELEEDDEDEEDDDEALDAGEVLDAAEATEAEAIETTEAAIEVTDVADAVRVVGVVHAPVGGASKENQGESQEETMTMLMMRPMITTQMMLLFTKKVNLVKQANGFGRLPQQVIGQISFFIVHRRSGRAAGRWRRTFSTCLCLLCLSVRSGSRFVVRACGVRLVPDAWWFVAQARPDGRSCCRFGRVAVAKICNCSASSQVKAG